MQLARHHSLLAVAFFTFAFALPLSARAADYTDIWWAPCTPGPNCDTETGHESGWGVNFVQNQDVVFATFYIYDTAKKPIWVSSPMFVNGAGTSYSGTLYQTTGSFFGGAWNPSDVTKPPVGTSTFTPTSATTGTLNYTVNNVPGVPNVVVLKNIERSMFRTIILGGTYIGTGVVTVTGCSDNSNNGSTSFDVDPQITQNLSGQIGITLSFGSSETCVLSGPAVQEGQLVRITNSSYVCTIGTTTTLNTTANVYEVKATSVGIEGRWFANTGGGCQESGRFSGVLCDPRSPIGSCL
jgi:hypothetical protein